MIRAMAAGLGCALAAAAPAAAQPGADVGGIVDGLLRLELDTGTGLSLPAAGAGTLTMRATVVATEGPVALSVADGDRQDGPRLGRMESPSGAPGDALEAASPDGAFAPLAAEPLLRLWSREIGATTTEIRLRRARGDRERPGGPFTKTVLVTATVGGP